MVDVRLDPAVRKILVIKWSALGDVALASAAFEDIHRAFPAGTVHLNTLPGARTLFTYDPRFAQVLAIDLRGHGRRLRGGWQWLRAVRREHYDLVIDLQSSDHSRLLLGLLCASGRGPRYRVGHHAVYPYNIWADVDANEVHALELMRAALRRAGIPPTLAHPRLFPGAEHRERAQRLLATHGVIAGTYAVFLPGCQREGYLKRWGVRRYAALALALRARGVRHTLLLGAADEWEECRGIREACGDFVIDLCGRTELLDLVPLCEGAALVVANDTGTAHIAAAAQRPLVVVCGPTDPRRVRPAGRTVATVQAPLYCVNCYRKHCSHHSCMLVVSPRQVLEQLEELGAFG